ncbi:hypothetical protein JCM5353_002351 [Sporobolomyces roseus]
MLSSTLFTIATSLCALSTSAAPLRTRQTAEYCSPQIDGTLSTSISPAFDTLAHWNWLSGEKSRDTTIVTETGHGGELPYGTYMTITRQDGATDQYRIGVGEHDGVNVCLAPHDDEIWGVDCSDSDAAWKISCSNCEMYNGHPQGNCRFESTKVGLCATFTDFDQPLNLTECAPIGEGDVSNPQNNPQQFIF